jgi:hypothetical protein
MYQTNRDTAEAKAYADQTAAVTRMRGVLEDEAASKLTA